MFVCGSLNILIIAKDYINFYLWVNEKYLAFFHLIS